MRKPYRTQLQGVRESGGNRQDAKAIMKNRRQELKALLTEEQMAEYQKMARYVRKKAAENQG